jgi:acetate kinase
LRRSRSNWTRHIRIAPHCASSAIVSAGGSTAATIGTVAHRIVHGGSKYFMPVRLDANVLADLKGYIPLAPLHQPFALEAVEILLREQPDLPQMACFDTAFHHTLPQVEKILPLPYAAWERGLRRYGFHGLSYEYMAVALPERHGDAACGRTVVAHWAVAPVCAPCKDSKAWPPPWASPRLTA